MFNCSQVQQPHCWITAIASWLAPPCRGPSALYIPPGSLLKTTLLEMCFPYLETLYSVLYTGTGSWGRRAFCLGIQIFHLGIQHFSARLQPTFPSQAICSPYILNTPAPHLMLPSYVPLCRLMPLPVFCPTGPI